MIRKNRGFTLLEVMIAVTILAILTSLTAETIQRALKSKKKIQDDIDRESKVRNAMHVIEKDINSAFHYRDFSYEMQEDIRKQQAQNPGGGIPGAPPPPPPPGTDTAAAPPPKQFTVFIGSESELNFTSLNHVRMMKDAQESDQEEVGYSVSGCKSLKDDKGGGKCLRRRTSPFIDDDVTKGGAEIVLLENVIEFKLRYLGKGKEDWTGQWRTDERGDESTRDKFPQAVEVTLAVKDTKEFGLTSVFPIQFPNNKPEKKDEPPQAPAK